MLASVGGRELSPLWILKGLYHTKTQKEHLIVISCKHISTFFIFVLVFIFRNIIV